MSDKITNFEELEKADEDTLNYVLSEIENDKERKAVEYLMMGIRKNREKLKAALRERLGMFEDDKRYDDGLVKAGQKLELRRVLGEAETPEAKRKGLGDE